jgi:hypothetical protein
MNKLLRNTVAGVAMLGALTGCSLDSLVKVKDPQVGADVDLDYLETRAGALALLYSTLGSLQSAVSQTAENVSYFTDELISRPYSSLDGNLPDYSPDSRFEVMHTTSGVQGIQFPAYGTLQMARIKATQARYFLKFQADSSLNYAISASYAYEGYAIVLLAENVCSGVPLSDAPYGEPVIYGRALSTDSLFRIAVAKFDSALMLSHDSARFRTLAKIGKARALVSLGEYAEAAQTVSDVAPGDTYTLTYTEEITPDPNAVIPSAGDAFWTISTSTRPQSLLTEIVNLEGMNGLIWYSDPTNIDPRLPVTVTTTGGVSSFPSVVRQRKFPNGNVTFPLARWVEAKMIEAEHLLNSSDPTWIDAINEARRTVGLPDTTAPATKAEQIDLLFRERAYWFYGEGTRLSDMRRLVRQYGRPVNSVYPVGAYTRSRQVFSYGEATTFIPSVNEYISNYNYTGCIHKNP